METPLIVTLARQMSVQNEIDVIANNIANMSTTAYKGEHLMFKDYLARTGSGRPVTFPQIAGLNRIDREGTIQKTSNPLDVAIKGEGYFTIQTPNGTRYTRNGHFSLDNQGQLVTDEGYQVMDTTKRPFVFDPSVKQITIAKDGTVSADDNRLGKIALVKFSNPQALKRQGGSLFNTDEAPQPAKGYELYQGHLEGSNVVPVLEITRFMRASSYFQAAKNVADSEDTRQRKAIETLGALPQ